MSTTGLNFDKLLQATIEDPSLRNVAIGIFEYANVLLDDDENLTRIGNLNGVAKGKLRERTMELLGVDTSTEVAPDTDIAADTDVAAEVDVAAAIADEGSEP